MSNQNYKEQIVQFIQARGQTRVDDLWRQFRISKVLIHRYLKSLLSEGRVARVGKPPLVFYIYMNGDLTVVPQDLEIPKKIKDVIESEYLYVTPLGEVLQGVAGFLRWVKDIKEEKRAANLAVEYVHNRTQANVFINRFGYINATERIKAVFPDTLLDKLYYLDFYSLPKFGKTKLGQLVLYAKQTQKITLIEEIFPQFKHVIQDIIKRYKIDAVGFIPPTIPRKYQFQKEMEKLAKIKLHRIELVKAYVGDIPVAQKSLSKLEDRITNARGSIFLKDENKKYDNVLLIDDAVGSGATLNETAQKLKQAGTAKKVIGLAVVGSYKGFEVIREI
ncbi:MAG: hypothetical protein UW68_C0002G0019 [Candidatus Collierbacteria bacterium GW2011_GWB1_44_6]|uniref:Uncharacterized protein n=2 Tax=Candidatus Collieribacteriota TaxID=1752725 RepID=A0A0G1JQP9_9BACT|nr:MAG: hypothetical protein UV68_C0004G0019 [Candidatus Collierbacteria bacterium GW2011_GWC2_43_12]KKT73750.1 MAG: hypothetical protein UW68_C0002G0019 [Candidatus Collierbacteria bacterium GW2011_GWB1_44_6]